MWAGLDLTIQVSGFHFGCISWVWSHAWSRHSSNSLECMYEHSLFIFVLPHVEIMHCKRKRNKCKLNTVYKPRLKVNMRVRRCTDDKTRVGVGLVNTKKAGLGVFERYRRGYVHCWMQIRKKEDYILGVFMIYDTITKCNFADLQKIFFIDIFNCNWVNKISFMFRNN